jgi:hypothetical protein
MTRIPRACQGAVRQGAKVLCQQLARIRAAGDQHTARLPAARPGLRVRVAGGIELDEELDEPREPLERGGLR